MSEFDPELIVMQAASTEPDTRMIEALMGDVLRMATPRNLPRAYAPWSRHLGETFT